MIEHRTVFIDQGEMLGGAELYLLEVIDGLGIGLRRQFGVRVLGAQNPDYRAKLPSDIPVDSIPLPSFKGGFFKKIAAGFKLLGAGRTLRKWAKLTKPTTLITNTPRAHFLVLVSGAWRRARWVMIVHDFHTQKRFWSSVHQWLRTRILRRAHTIVAVSMATRKLLLEGFSHSVLRLGQKIQIIENGIEMDYAPFPRAVQAVKNVLILGRIDPRKGQLKVAQAAQLLRDTNLHFTIVGASTEKDPDTVAYEANIRAYIAEHALTNITLPGPTNSPLEAMNAADVVVLMPTEAETFGRVAVEGLSVGKVVVSPKVTGPWQILKEYGAFAEISAESFLLPENTAEALAERLRQLHEHPEVLTPLTEHARAFVTEKYTLKHTVQRWAKLLLNV